LATTVPLIVQQCEYLKKLLACSIEDYYGEKRLDNKVLELWDKKMWERELNKNQILVMTPQILVDMLHHAFIGLALVKPVLY
jgi:endoribonuclease Dicer